MIKFFLINAGLLVRMIYKIMQPFLDPVVAKKVN